jgi:RIO kinase 3
LSKIGRTGYREENGKILTKHDENLSGRKNAGKIMELQSDFPSGDCGNFDMKVSNKVFNELRNHSNLMSKKKNQARLDRKADMMTNEMGVDVNTRLILYKLINTQCILDNIDGIVSTGKEAVILHGESNQHNEEHPNLPKEVAIKIFSTTLNEFKQRDRYIRDDYRFKGTSKQNNKNIIQQWCEKELHNLTRLKKAGIRCPEVVVMKKHVLVMSYIGRGHDMPAPKLKEVVLSDAEWICAYDEVVGIMKRMYDVARLVHADFSEYNILWHEGHCVVIDLAQAVEPLHPAALEFLMRDCDNITSFFEKRSVPVVSKEELFFDITKLDPLTTNTTMLERIHMKGEAPHVMNRPMNFDDVEREKVPEQFRLKEFPFDYAWQKVEELKEKSKNDWEIINAPADEEEEDDDWVQVKPASKKKPKRKSESNTIIDNKIADSLKEISVSLT